MLSLVAGRFESAGPGCERLDGRPLQWPTLRVSAPRRSAPMIIPVTMVRVERRPTREFRRAVAVLRLGVLAGSLMAAWQIGMVIGAL